MAYWEIRTIIETDDEDVVWNEKMIREKIQQDANRGDGMYMDCDDECHIKLIQPYVKGQGVPPVGRAKWWGDELLKRRERL